MASKKVASAYIDLQLQTAQFKAAIGEATGEMKKFSAQTREEMNKSRESVKLMSEELGLGIPRGLTNVISKLPGLTTALNLAFDGVVVFALGKTIYDVGEKIVEFAKKSEDAAKKNAAAWQLANTGLQDHLDELTLTGSKLDDEIAKLSNVPRNGLATALAEANVNADTLAKSLQTDLGLMDQLFKDQQVGFFSQLLGKAGNDDIIKQLSDDRSNIERAAQAGRDAVRDASTLEDKNKARDAAKKSVDDLTAKAINNIYALYNRINGSVVLYNGAGVASYSLVHGDQTQNNALLYGAKGIFANSKDIYDIEFANQNKEKKVNGLNQQKDSDSLRLKSMEDTFAKQKAMFGASVTDEINYWTMMLSEFKKGSNAYRTIQDKLYQDYEERSKKLDAVRKSTRIANVPQDVVDAGEQLQKMIIEQADDVLHTGEAWKQFNSELAKGYEDYDKFNQTLQETKIRLAESTGAISPHEAALQQAALHAEAYAKALENLQDELKKVNGDSSLTNAQRSASALGISNQISQLGYNNQLQQLEDTVNMHKTSALGGIDAVFDEFEARSKDIGGLLKENLTEAINSINDAIIHILTTKQQPGDHPFREAGKQIFTNVAKSSLQTAEGGVMSLLGLGSNSKLGTKGNPMYVLFANALTGTASSLASGAASAASNGGLWAGLAHLIIPRASGGLMSPGDLYLTGEQGPELLQVGSTSKINNARDTASMMNGRNGDTHIHLGGIDARGATDPAAVIAAVQRGIRAASPHIAAAAIAAQKDHERRVPTNRS